LTLFIKTSKQNYANVQFFDLNCLWNWNSKIKMESNQCLFNKIIKNYIIIHYHFV